MKRMTVRRTVAVFYLLSMAVLVAWLVSLGRMRFYFLSLVIVLLAACLWLVRPGRYWLYAVGVLLCLATLTTSSWPTDPPEGNGFCGSVINPGQAKGAYDGPLDSVSYFNACDQRMATHIRLVAVGGILTGLVLGASIIPLRRREGGDLGDSPSVREKQQ